MPSMMLAGHGGERRAADRVPRRLAMGTGAARASRRSSSRRCRWSPRKRCGCGTCQRARVPHRHHRGRSAGRLHPRQPARRRHRLYARHVADRRVRAVALYPGAADRAQGGVRAAVHPVDGLHGLSENPGRDPDRVLPGDGQRADRDPHRRSRPDQSRPRVQGDAARRFSGRSNFRPRCRRCSRGFASARRWRWSASWWANWSAAIWGSAICCRSARARPTPRWCSSRS